MRSRLSALALILAAAASRPQAADPKIQLIKGENLTVLGDASVRDLRSTAILLDQFRSAVSVLLPSARHLTVPTHVFVFSSHKTMEPFLPLYNGKPIDAAGYFQGGPEQNYIVVTASETPGDEQATRTILHEYTHMLQNAAAGGMPPWFSEGMAEYFSTFRMDGGDDRKAFMGRVIPSHVLLLREQFLPFTEMLGVTRTSRVYNEDDVVGRRGIFYAEAWATFHYIIAEVPNAGNAINQYVNALINRMDSVAAFESVFGPAADFGRRVQEYVRRVGFKTYSFNLPGAPQVQQASQARVLTSSEAQGRLGALQLRARRTGEAKARIEGATSDPKPSAQAYLALGRLRESEQRQDDALAAFQKAAEVEPDDFTAQYAYGANLLRNAVGAKAIGIANPDEAARAALTKAVALNELAGDAFERLSVACMRLSLWDEARNAVLRATALAPGKQEYAYQLAQIDFLQGNNAAGRTRLGMIIQSAPDSPIGKLAAEQLERMNDPRIFGARSASPASSNASTATGTSAASSSSSPSPSTLRSSMLPRPVSLQLRKLQPGEVREIGDLTNLECGSNGGVRVHLRTPTRAIVATAKELGQIELVTFRDTEFTIACGVRPANDRVYLTFRAAANASDVVAGEAVALEFLPADYVPPAR